MRGIIAAAIGLVAGLASPAMASNWLEVGKGDDFVISVDLESIQWTGDIVTYWDKWDSFKPGDKLLSATVQGKMNCTNRTRQIIYMVEYNRDGTNGSSPGSNTWRPITPDTTADAVRIFLCARKPTR